MGIYIDYTYKLNIKYYNFKKALDLINNISLYFNEFYYQPSLHILEALEIIGLVDIEDDIFDLVHEF